MVDEWVGDVNQKMDLFPPPTQKRGKLRTILFAGAGLGAVAAIGYAVYKLR